MNNKYFTVCGIVEIGGRILLVRHTYGTAKGRILVPGGYVQENEMPSRAVEREIREETGVEARARSVFAVQFKPLQWCIVFTTEYISGRPETDNNENSEVLLLDAEEAVNRRDITNMSREILRSYIRSKNDTLSKSDYTAPSSLPGEYEIYGV